jgi:AcrR family transcriptional regulator
MSRQDRPARTQQERRDGTRRALLDAAVESLIEVGFARTTTLEVQKRAGVSRGALLHHFPSKAVLLTAAIDHLAEMRGRELKARATSLPGGGERVDAVLDLLWECFGGALFQVAVELRAAARTDAELRAVLTAAERALRDRIVQQARALFGPALGEQPGFDRAIDLTLQLMIGLAMTAMLHGNDGTDDLPVAGQSRVVDLLADWKRFFPSVVSQAASPGPPPPSLSSSSSRSPSHSPSHSPPRSPSLSPSSLDSGES